MKRCLLALAVFTIPAFATAAQAETPLTADLCQPLSAENTARCCSAANWRDIILPESQALCTNNKDQTTAQPVTDGTVGTAAPDEGSGTATDTDTGSTTPVDNSGTATDDQGNPGNAAGVGGAGEQDKDNESPSTGTAGNSN